jgi:hypothetical protein
MIALLDRGYEARSYESAELEKSHLILRHDIDMSLDAALPIAEIEKSFGLRAHYFVLVRTEMYNLFSAQAGRVLRELAALGHEIGLHFDASLHDPADLDHAAAAECAALELATSAAVRTISFHRPAQMLLGYPDRLAGRLHAYQPRFYSEMGYCSDSQGAWRHGHPLLHSAVRKKQALQLLTHPIWWNGTDSETPIARLDRFAASRDNVLRKELAANCKPYQAVYSAKREQ